MLKKCSVTIKDIGGLLIHLPGKDFSIGSKFLAERKFEELLELVESCIKQYKRSPTYREKYPDFNMDGMMELRAAVQEYFSFLCIEEDIADIDYETLEKIEEYDEEFCCFVVAGERIYL